MEAGGCHRCGTHGQQPNRAVPDGAVDLTAFLVRKNQRLLGSGDEADPVALFPLVPLLEIDRGAIICGRRPRTHPPHVLAGRLV